MIRRFLFIIIASGLALVGLYFRAANTKDANAQVAHILQLDAQSRPVLTAVNNLKKYAETHIGASVKFTLNQSYQRAQAAAKAAETSAQAANSQIYTQAQAACASKSDSITQARCNQEYLAKHLVNIPTPTPVVQPRLTDYQYDIKSPFWAPDLPGALFLGSIIAFILGIFNALKQRKHL